MAEFSKMCHNYYGLKMKHITTRNPQSNAIIKRIHKNIGNIIRAFDVSNIVNNNPWSVILAATMFYVCATYHTTLQASPMKLLFGWDAILNIKHVVDWEHIWQRTRLRMNHNNKRENMRRNNHQYKVGEKTLVKRKKTLSTNQNSWVCSPLQKWITMPWFSSKRGIINDATNIRRIKPFID